MTDDYEVANNLNGGLNPNSDDALGDLDMDTLSNFDEFDGFLSGVQTRADLADTDDDGLADWIETNAGDWLSPTDTGSNPTIPDTDNDGLLDGEENLETTDITSAPFRSDPNIADTDDDGFGDAFEAFSGTDGNDADDFPTVTSVAAKIQFDFGTGGGSYAPTAGTAETPAHTLGLLGDNDVVFNVVADDDSSRTLLSSTGDSLGSIEIDFGIEAGGIFDFTPGALVFSFVALPDSIYDTELMADWIFTNSDNSMVVRVQGLAAGSYHVIALSKESGAGSRTKDVSIGTQIGDESEDPVFGSTFSAPASVPTEWIVNENYFNALVTIAEDDYIVVRADATNSQFSSMQGLQIIPVDPVSDIVITRSVLSGNTVTIDYIAAPDTSYTLGQNFDLQGGFSPTAATSTTDGNGVGQFTLTVDTATNPKQFFQISEQ